MKKIVDLKILYLTPPSQLLSVSFLNYEHEPVDGENENILKLFVLHLLLPAIKLYLNGNKKSLIKILDLIMQAHW